MTKNKKKYFSGSIFKRKNRNTLYIKFHNKEISTGFKDNPLGWKLAEKMLEKLNYDYYQNQGLIELNKNIKNYFDEFIEFKKLRVSTRTLKDYKKAIEKSGILDCKLNEIEIKNTLYSFVNKCLKNGLNKRAINIYLREIFVFINFLIDKRAIPKIKKSEFELDGGQKPYQSYNENEYKMLYSYFEKIDIEIAYYIKFLWLTGARRTETLELTWQDIDFEKREIRFRVKNRKNNYDIFPITDEILKLLKKLKEMNNKKIFRWEAVSASFLSKKVREAEKKLGIYKQNRGLHSFRKSFAEKLFSNKKDIPIIRKLMRHKDISTTIKHYNYYTTKELLKELEEIEKK